MSVNKNMLPGMGGQESETFAGGATGTGIIDVTKVAALIFQVTAKSGNSTTITVQESTDNTNWADLTTFSSTLATIKKLIFTAGPFALIRLKADGSTGSNTISITGLRLPIGS